MNSLRATFGPRAICCLCIKAKIWYASIQLFINNLKTHYVSAAVLPVVYTPTATTVV